MPALKPAALSGSTIYLNNCKPNGCMIQPGGNMDDMTTDPITSRAASQPVQIAPSTDIPDDQWADIVQCVKEVYSPFDVKIVSAEPGNDVAVYSGIVVGGNQQAKAAAALGLPPGTGGIGGGDCNPDPRGVAYAFADTDNLRAFAFEVLGEDTPQARVLAMCWIIAQETAHTFGLDHEFSYVDDNSSACNDPMTYRFECGGQKFFRNRIATCGEFKEMGSRPCRCGANQNSHLKLVNLLGPGTSLIPPPTIAYVSPNASSTAANSLGSVVNVMAGSKRGVARVELYVNGFLWATAKGSPFGRTGQANPSNYQLLIPAALPDSIVDIQVKAFDDLDLVGESEVITVVKGAAGGCQSADTCAEGQKCEGGKCFWDPPAGQLGDPCTFPQACISGLCSDTVFQGDGICTQSCVVGIADSCPEGLECLSAGADSVCFTPLDDGGCCSTTNETPWAPFAFGAAILGFLVFGPRRRRR